MKKQDKNVVVIKLFSPKGETMVWKTSISHVSKNRVKDLNVAKRNFAHYLVNKYWLLEGKAIEVPISEEESFIRPIASSKEELFLKKEEMRKEIEDLSSLIVAKRVRFVPKKKNFIKYF